MDNKVDKFLMGTEVPKSMISKQNTLFNERVQLHQSKIMTSFNEFKVIETLFLPRILKSLKLLYRAS